MTTEEKIAELINIRDNFNYTLSSREVFDDAIEALKQVASIDKAREEILNLADSDAYGDYQQGFSVGLNVAAQVIDRFKECK